MGDIRPLQFSVQKRKVSKSLYLLGQTTLVSSHKPQPKRPKANLPLTSTEKEETRPKPWLHAKASKVREGPIPFKPIGLENHGDNTLLSPNRRRNHSILRDETQPISSIQSTQNQCDAIIHEKATNVSLSNTIENINQRPSLFIPHDAQPTSLLIPSTSDLPDENAVGEKTSNLSCSSTVLNPKRRPSHSMQENKQVVLVAAHATPEPFDARSDDVQSHGSTLDLEAAITTATYQKESVQDGKNNDASCSKNKPLSLIEKDPSKGNEKQKRNRIEVQANAKDASGDEKNVASTCTTGVEIETMPAEPTTSSSKDVLQTKSEKKKSIIGLNASTLFPTTNRVHPFRDRRMGSLTENSNVHPVKPHETAEAITFDDGAAVNLAIQLDVHREAGEKLAASVSLESQESIDLNDSEEDISTEITETNSSSSNLPAKKNKDAMALHSSPSQTHVNAKRAGLMNLFRRDVRLFMSLSPKKEKNNLVVSDSLLIHEITRGTIEKLRSRMKAARLPKKQVVDDPNEFPVQDSNGTLPEQMFPAEKRRISRGMVQKQNGNENVMQAMTKSYQFEAEKVFERLDAMQRKAILARGENKTENNSSSAWEEPFFGSRDLKDSAKKREAMVEACMEKLLGLEDQQSWQRAIQLATRLIARYPFLYQSFLIRARCWTRLGLYYRAEQDLTQAIRLHPSDVRLLILRARLYCTQQMKRQAIHELNGVLETSGYSKEALYLRADIYASQGLTFLAIKDLTHITTVDPREASAHYQRALLLFECMTRSNRPSGHNSMDTEGHNAMEIKERELHEQGTYAQQWKNVIHGFFSALKNHCIEVKAVECLSDAIVRCYEVVLDVDVLQSAHLKFCKILDALASSYPTVATIKDGKEMSLESEHRMTLKKQVKAFKACLLAHRGRLEALQHQWNLALKSFDTSLQVDAQCTLAYLFRGIVQSILGLEKHPRNHLENDALPTEEYQRILLDLSHALSWHAHLAGAYVAMGTLSLSLKHYHSCLSNFQSALQHDPTLLEVWLQTAILYQVHAYDNEACLHATSVVLQLHPRHRQALLIRAEGYARKGARSQALQDYLRLLHFAHPDAGEWPHLLACKLLLELGRPTQALHACLRFLEVTTHLTPVTVGVLKGKVMLLVSNFIGAIDEFKKVVAVHPTSENFCLLSKTLHAAGKVEEALLVIDHAAAATAVLGDRANVDGTQQIMLRAKCFDSMGNFTLAIQAYDKALALNPQNATALHARALTRVKAYMKILKRLQIDRIKHRMRIFQGSTKVTSRHFIIPKQKSHRIGLTGLELQARLYVDMAVQDFQRATQVTETSPAFIWVDLADFYTLNEKFKEAMECHRKAIASDATCVKAYINYGFLLGKFQQYPDAIEQYNKALEHSSQSILAHYNRGVAYHRLDMYHRAEQDYSACIGIRPHFVEARKNRAICRCRLLNYAGALEDFCYLKSLLPHDSELCLGLGYVYMKMGNFSEASNYFRNITLGDALGVQAFVELGHTSYEIAKTTQNLKEKKRLLTEALKFYLKAKRLKPAELNVHLYIAKVFHYMNQWEGAYNEFSTILAIQPTNYLAYEGRSVVNFYNKDVEGAIKDINSAIQMAVMNDPYIRDKYMCFSTSSIGRHQLRQQLVGIASARQRTSAAAAAATIALNKDPLETSFASQADNALALNVNLDKGGILGLITQEIVGNSFGCTSRGFETRKVLSKLLLNKAVYTTIHTRKQDGSSSNSRSEYLTALHFDPWNAQVYLKLGTNDLAHGDIDQAMHYLQKALALNPSSAAATLNLGVAVLCRGNHGPIHHHPNTTPKRDEGKERQEEEEEEEEEGNEKERQEEGDEKGNEKGKEDAETEVAETETAETAAAPSRPHKAKKGRGGRREEEEERHQPGRGPLFGCSGSDQVQARRLFEATVALEPTCGPAWANLAELLHRLDQDQEKDQEKEKEDQGVGVVIPNNDPGGGRPETAAPALASATAMGCLTQAIALAPTVPALYERRAEWARRRGHYQSSMLDYTTALYLRENTPPVKTSSFSCGR